MTEMNAWNTVDGVHESLISLGAEPTHRWSEEGEQPGHFIGHIGLADGSHLAWDPVTGWTHHTADGPINFAESDADPRDVAIALV